MCYEDKEESLFLEKNLLLLVDISLRQSQTIYSKYLRYIYHACPVRIVIIINNRFYEKCDEEWCMDLISVCVYINGS